MANRWKGNIITATTPNTSGTAYTGKADGLWSMQHQLQQIKSNLWAKAIGPPSPPTITSVSKLNSGATVTLTPSSDTGGGTLTYRVTSSPGNISAESASTVIPVPNLTNGTTYTFTAIAISSLGYTSSVSNTSQGVVPGATMIGLTGNASNVTIYTFDNGLATRLDRSNTFNDCGGYFNTWNSPGTLYAIGQDRHAKLLGNSNESFISVYPIGSVIGTALGLPSGGNPGSQFGVGGMVFHPTAEVLIATNGPTTPIAIYDISTGGWGVKHGNPPGLPSTTAYNINISKNGSCLSLSPDGQAGEYTWNSPGNVSSKWANRPVGNRHVAFNQASTVIAFNCSEADVTPGRMNRLSGNAYGTAYNAPASPLNSTGLKTYRAFFNKDDTVVLFARCYNGNADATATYVNMVSAYSWSNSSGYGTKFSDPSTSGFVDGNKGCSDIGNAPISWAPLDKSAFTALSAWAPTINVVTRAWSNGFGTIYSDPSGFEQRDFSNASFTNN
jgi:hypothetical protein